VGPYVQVAAQGDDIGMQQSTYISPEMYRRFIKPLHKKIFDLIHSRTRAKVFLHTCGSVYAILPDLIEIGLDVLNPVQSSAAHMDLGRLKTEFGKDLCFWGGGIDIQQQLPFLDPREIRLEIQKTLRIMAPGGGYVFAFTHNVQPDVPPEKVDGAWNFPGLRETGDISEARATPDRSNNYGTWILLCSSPPQPAAGGGRPRGRRTSSPSRADRPLPDGVLAPGHEQAKRARRSYRPGHRHLRRQGGLGLQITTLIAGADPILTWPVPASPAGTGRTGPRALIAFADRIYMAPGTSM
jgi:hypothetical protein